MRTKLSFELVCAACGTPLECGGDSPQNRVVFDSSDTAKAVMAIAPCTECMNKAQRPARLIRQALAEMEAK